MWWTTVWDGARLVSYLVKDLQNFDAATKALSLDLVTVDSVRPLLGPLLIFTPKEANYSKRLLEFASQPPAPGSWYTRSKMAFCNETKKEQLLGNILELIPKERKVEWTDVTKEWKGNGWITGRTNWGYPNSHKTWSHHLLSASTKWVSVLT